jgi:hypothetical protein
MSACCGDRRRSRWPLLVLMGALATVLIVVAAEVL